MPKQRTDLEKAAGLLISAVQREWGFELGDAGAHVSEEVMHHCHSLLRAAKIEGGVRDELGGASVTDYLGRAWVRRHPNVLPAISSLERLLADGGMPNNSFKPKPPRGSV
jgi:hypothetical protein